MKRAIIVLLLAAQSAEAFEMPKAAINFGLGQSEQPDAPDLSSIERPTPLFGEGFWLFDLAKPTGNDGCAFKMGRRSFGATCPLRRGR